MRVIKKNKDSKDKNFVPVLRELDKNIEFLEDIFQDCDDIVSREFTVGVNQNHRMYISYVDVMTNEDMIQQHVLRPLLLEARLISPDPGDIKKKLFELVLKGTLSASDIEVKDNLDEAVLAILSGDTILLIDGVTEFIVISTKGWPTRGLSEPPGESVIRGPRVGFVETFRYNTVLLRRSIKDPRLKIKNTQLGERTKTNMGIAYIDDIVNYKVLEELENRLETTHIDGIFESGQVEQLIEDDWLSLFPQIQNTERPDIVSAALLQGKVALIIDNTPTALIVPTTFNDFMQFPEDYYERWWIANLIRWIRLSALIISFTLPSIYIAVASYHPGIIPSNLAIFIAGTRETVPFPVFIEALIMEITFELLREAGVRLPNQLGSTIGIVGSLIIGQAAVEAGLVSPIMVIIVALTAIASFSIPSYNFTISFRILRFIAMVATGFLGLYGLILVVIATLVHLSVLKSFGVPYLAPIVSGRMTDWKDSIIKAPLPSIKERNSYTAWGDRKKLRDLRVDIRARTVDIEPKEDGTIDKGKNQPSHTQNLKKPRKIGNKDNDRGEKDE